jgi:FkbM family methyltransferase
MIETIRQLMNFLRHLGLIIANKGGFQKDKQLSLFKDYLIFKTLCLLPRFIRIKKLQFIGHPLSFFDLKTTTALIESIFIENEYFFRSKTKKPVIIDLGSNIGLSIIYLKTLYPNCSIQAFEADPITVKVLLQNMNRYHYKKIIVNNLAVSNRNGYLDFYTAKNPGSPLMSTSPQRIKNSHKIRVKSIKLSETIKGRVDFLKIDIEGSESGVLKDLDSSQQIKLINQMSIEYHHHLNTNTDSLSKFLKILEENHFGYQIHAGQNTPFSLKIFEDIQIHSYNKNSPQAKSILG